MPQLRSEFQVSISTRFKVIAFYIFVYEFVKYAGKKHKDFQRKASRKSQLCCASSSLLAHNLSSTLSIIGSKFLVWPKCFFFSFNTSSSSSSSFGGKPRSTSMLKSSSSSSASVVENSVAWKPKIAVTIWFESS